MILGDGCTLEELFRYAGRAGEGDGEREKERREVVMGRKWKVEVCPSLRWFIQVTPDWRECSVACILHRLLWKKLYILFMFHTLSWWGCTLRGWRDGGDRRGESVWCSGGVITRCGAEGWELDGYFILSIGVCKWKCQSSRKTNESDRRDATSLTECLINCHCLFLGADVFRCYFLIVFSAWPGCLRLRVWWWTLSQGNKGIDLRQESMLSSVTYKSGPVKSDFGLEFSNWVSKVNINKGGCAISWTIWLPLPQLKTSI